MAILHTFHILVIYNHMCTEKSMYVYLKKYVIIAIHSYNNIIQDVLVEMYSYSALSNVLVLSHHQCTRTCTLLMKMYSAPGLAVTHQGSTERLYAKGRQSSYSLRIDKAAIHYESTERLLSMGQQSGYTLRVDKAAIHQGLQQRPHSGYTLRVERSGYTLWVDRAATCEGSTERLQAKGQQNGYRLRVDKAASG